MQIVTEHMRRKSTLIQMVIIKSQTDKSDACQIVSPVRSGILFFIMFSVKLDIAGNIIRKIRTVINCGYVPSLITGIGNIIISYQHFIPVLISTHQIAEISL